MLLSDKALRYNQVACPAQLFFLHPGGLSQIGTIKTATSTLTRIIFKLCILPYIASSDSFVNIVAKERSGGLLKY